MSRQFLTSLNLTKNELQNAVMQNLSSAPGSPVAGQMYYDTTANRWYVYNGVATAWQNKATDSDLLQGQNAAYHLARANHTGTQLAATISNLSATVLAYTLDTFAAPVAAISMGSQRVTSVATPFTGTDAANKAYVDLNVQGLSPKPTAMVATAAVLSGTPTYSNGTAGVGATLTAAGNGTLTVDGYLTALGDLILVKNQASAFQNGLYTVTTVGAAGATYVLTRHVDMDTSAEFGGAFIPVENNGTTTANTLWLVNAAASITVGTTAVNFTQLNAATAYTAGNGINIAANTISAVVDPAAGAGLALTASGLKLDTTVAVRKYAVAFGDGSAVSYVITHSLGTQDVEVNVYSATTPWAEVECDVQHTSTTTITLIFAVAPTTNQYRVVVHG